ncbi:MAG: nucleotidyltransferase family protein [Kiritimatiellae bacterium]|nr:nucleotidyltransferase family protein [Kiritimatiellia bacterium]
METQCFDLLILCMRPRLESTDTARLARLAEAIDDWKLLIQQAQNHRITPLLYKHLHDHCSASVPENAMEHMQHLFMANASRNVLLIETMAEVLNTLESHNINPLVFKGPALAVDVFDDPNMRQFDDIDFIIPENKILETYKILTSKGYEPQLSLTPNQAKAYLRSQRDWVFIHRKTGVILDINSTITPRYFRLPFPANLYTSSRTISIAGHNTNTLSVEHLLSALLAHGTYHQWNRLSWLCDIAALLDTHPDINWSCVQKQSESMHCNRMLHLGLLLTADLLHAKIPEDIRKYAKNDRATTRLRDQILEQFSTESPEAQTIITKCRFHIRARERFADKLFYLLRFLFVPTISDWKFINIPRSLWILYYLARPVRLIGKALAHAGLIL